MRLFSIKSSFHSYFIMKMMIFSFIYLLYNEFEVKFMKLTILGTGNAIVTKCYNTCFLLSDDNRHFLVDGGGGNTLLVNLEKAGISFKDIHDIFVTHKHIDHLLGIIWMIRLVLQGKCRHMHEGDVRIYAPCEVIDILVDLSMKLFNKKEAAFINNGLYFIGIEDKEKRMIIDKEVIFFDIHSSKDTQFGFSIQYDENHVLTCLGDEPYNDTEREYVENADWLLHEAFCLYSQADIFKPYEKHHSTAKDACILARDMHVKNIVLYHTEDKNISNRKELYINEGKEYFDGKIFVPDDLDVIEL